MGPVICSGRPQQSLAVQFLQTVPEHRPADLLEQVVSELHHAVRANTDEVVVVGRVMESDAVIARGFGAAAGS